MAHVTLVHGMANKPPADLMLSLWLRALGRDDPKPEIHPPPNAGLDLATIGVSVDSVYWADVLYGTPETDISDYERGAEEHKSIEGVPVVATATAASKAAASSQWRADLSPAEAVFVRRLEKQLRFELGDVRDADVRDADVRATTVPAAERIPLPGFLKRPLMEMLLRDVHHYFFNVEYAPRPGERYRVRDELQRRFLEHVIAHAADRPHVIVCHSMGTILTYDCLRNRADCPAIDGLITLGSPLGLDEVQEAIVPDGTRVNFPTASLKGPWINIYDPLDPVVGFDPRFANDYRRSGAEVVEDIRESNWGKWRHNIVKYLGGPRLRTELKRLLAARESVSPGQAGAVVGTAAHRESLTPATRSETSRASGAATVPRIVAATALDPQTIRNLDREELSRLGDEIARAGTLDHHAATSEQIVAVASALHAQRLFPELRALAGSEVARRADGPALARLHAQALIEGGALEEAKAILRGLLKSTERLEATGLVGRIEKQRYVDEVLTTGKGRPAQLRRAIDAYLKAFETDPARPYWHGVNALALLKLAERKHIRHGRLVDAARIARALVKRLQQDFANDRAQYWELASAGEACLVLDQGDLAELWYRRCLDADGVEPFALGSSIRQLKEVWGLNASEGLGKRLLPPLEAMLARIGKQALFAAEAVRQPDAGAAFEKIFGDTGFMSPEKIRLGLKRCEAVGRVEETTGDGVGTGFAIPGTALSDRWQGSFLFVTNNHVLSTTDADALRIANAQVTFHALRDSSGKPFSTRFVRIVRESAPDRLDYTVLELAEQPPGLGAYPVADALPTVASGQRLYVIGHPRGGGLMFSMQDNRLIDHGAPADGRVHYRTPTEPGSSGSPVFNGSWELVALHHAGSPAMKRIHGEGSYEANEGIWIQAIRTNVNA